MIQLMKVLGGKLTTFVILDNQETKRKMYSTILLIGGGMNFKGVDEFLLKRLQMCLPAHYQFMKEQMDVITRPKVSENEAEGKLFIFI